MPTAEARVWVLHTNKNDVADARTIRAPIPTSLWRCSRQPPMRHFVRQGKAAQEVGEAVGERERTAAALRCRGRRGKEAAPKRSASMPSARGTATSAARHDALTAEQRKNKIRWEESSADLHFRWLMSYRGIVYKERAMKRVAMFLLCGVISLLAGSRPISALEGDTARQARGLVV
jgi:hypothetical protein